MHTVEVKLYKFSELSDKAKEKAIEKHRYINVEDIDWWDGIEEDWNEKLNEKGFLTPKIYFSGFCSQGDGACFDCNQFDYDKLAQACGGFNDLEKALISFFYETEALGISIEKNGFANHYSHYNTRYITMDYGEYPEELEGLVKAKPEDLPLMLGQIDEDLKEILEIRLKNPDLRCEGVNTFMKRFESAIEELRSNLCKDIYRDLEREYYDLISDESVSYSLQEGDYEFTEDGEIW